MLEEATPVSAQPDVVLSEQVGAPVSPEEYPQQVQILEVGDQQFGTIREMASASELVVLATVTEVVSLGRPSLREDEYADEYLGITLSPTEVLKGESSSEPITIAWAAFNVNPAGERVAQWASNGVTPPALGDELIMFLTPALPAYRAHLGGLPNNQPVSLDGVLLVDGGVVVGGRPDSSVLAEANGKSADELRRLIAGN